MKKAAAYLRVSDERQDEFSPDSQLKLIREYCLKNTLELPEEFIFYDDGISARTTKNRKKFNEMIALAKQKEKPFETILVWKFSRFARNQEESIVYKAMLRKNGVDVISISEPIGDNPFGGLIERIIEWMDEYYLIRLSDEVRRGMTERAERGLPNTAPPFGYHMKNGTYVINEAEAPIIQKIFEMYASGNSIKAITSHLKSMDIKNRTGNIPDKRGVEYILNNPCYIGAVRWNPNGKASYRNDLQNPTSIIKKGSHPPIISEELFEKAKSITALRKKTYPRYHKDTPTAFMLKGLVKCHTCGATLVYQKSADGIQCHQYASGVCDSSHFIRMRIINEMVLSSLKNIAKDLSFSISVSESESKNLSIDYDKQISIENKKLSRAKISYLEGIDTVEEYQRTKEKIEKSIQNLEKEKIHAQASPPGVPLPDSVYSLSHFLENENVSEELKNLALQAILEKIVFYKPDRKIELYFYT